MPRATARKPRATRTRSETKDAFSEIVESQENAADLDPQAGQLASEHAAKVRGAVKLLSVDDIVAKGSVLGLEINRTLASLTEQCVGKANELKTIQDAIIVESKELERLYDLDIASAHIQNLIEEHNEKKELLEKSASEIRAAWDEEQKTHDKAVRQRDADLALSRRREEAEYEYSKRTQRAQGEDEFARKMQQKERELAERTAAVEKDLQIRQDVMAAQEKELTELRTRVAGIDQEITKHVSRDVAIATNALKKDLTHEHALVIKDFETKLQLSQQANQSLVASNDALAKQVVALTSAVDAAKQQVSEIAQKAIEGASGQVALGKVMELQQNNGAASKTGKS